MWKSRENICEKRFIFADFLIQYGFDEHFCYVLLIQKTTCFWRQTAINHIFKAHKCSHHEVFRCFCSLHQHTKLFMLLEISLIRWNFVIFDRLIWKVWWLLLRTENICIQKVEKLCKEFCYQMYWESSNYKKSRLLEVFHMDRVQNENTCLVSVLKHSTLPKKPRLQMLQNCKENSLRFLCNTNYVLFCTIQTKYAIHLHILFVSALSGWSTF